MSLCILLQSFCSHKWSTLDAWYKKQLYPGADENRFRCVCGKEGWREGEERREGGREGEGRGGKEGGRESERVVNC